MAFELPKLPYEPSALSPHMSSETFEYHYGKHHAAYVNKLNAAIEGTSHANQSLEDIIKNSEGGLFNNAAQHWNHSFFWNCLQPGGGGAPTGALLEAINRDFGDFEKFKQEFSQSAATLFGSGWAWLVRDNAGKLSIMGTQNADLPLKHGLQAVFTIDVWEHAYYIDYRNARPKFIETILNELANWNFASENFAS